MSGEPKFSIMAQGGPYLTPELANQNVEKYKTELFNLLKTETELSAHVFDKLVERGVLSPSSIQLDSNSWAGITRTISAQSKRQAITLGVADIPPKLAETIIFEHQRFGGNKSVVYRLSHELAHSVIDYHIKPESAAMDFFNQMRAMREGGVGISALGNLEYYKQLGPNVQTHEDLAELVNMFIIDQAYFARYLKFLSDPRMSDERERVGLIELDKDMANHLEEMVQNIVRTFFNE